MEKKPKSRKYDQAPMTDWYQPQMLANIALKAMISGTFGNYADRRELEAAVQPMMKDDNEWEKIIDASKNEENIWIDVINDTGDGFNSTYAIAHSAAQDELVFQNQVAGGDPIITERGKILILGGDEVYPFPTTEAYENKFKIPFGSACSQTKSKNEKEGYPQMFAIPGNHDWYDGLGNFLKVFCQQRTIGIWATKQRRSYFALPLSHNYWVWATDIQLNSDIDKPQLEYFTEVAMKYMKQDDYVILITAEPAWVYKAMHKKDKSFSKLEFFIYTYIRDLDPDHKRGRSFKLAATITGDLHHYSRYCKVRPGDGHPVGYGHQFITAGGGGAFMHVTHNLPPDLDPPKRNRKASGDQEEKIILQKTFPDTSDSKRLLFNNFLFPFKHVWFDVMISIMYLFFFYIYQSYTGEYLFHHNGGYCDLLHSFCSFTGFISSVPALVTFTLLVGGGFYSFTDTDGFNQISSRFHGALHGIIQMGLLIVTMFFISKYWYLHTEFNGFTRFLIVLAGCMAGSLACGFIMGSYLFFTNLISKMHITEASSSFASPHYKNFLRIKVHKDGLTIYPIGIKKVPKRWKQKPGAGHNSWIFSGNEVETFLIENPVEIHNKDIT